MSTMTFRVCDACKHSVNEEEARNEWARFVARAGGEPEAHTLMFDLCPSCGLRVEELLVGIAKDSANATGEQGDGR